jgi:AraC-like DNA-binding protein
VFIYILIKQGTLLKSYTDDLSHVIAQAQEVRKDLIELMDDALGLSQTIVDDLDSKLVEAEKSSQNTLISEENDKELEQEYPNKVVKLNPGNTSRLRVYDLAREFHISSRELVSILQSCGLKINSHMNLIDAEQARFLLNNINHFGEINPSSTQLHIGTSASGNNEADFIAGLQSAHPYMAVRSLYEKGYPIWQIAKILERGQGEISLILNLSKKKAGSI